MGLFLSLELQDPGWLKIPLSGSHTFWPPGPDPQLQPASARQCRWRWTLGSRSSRGRSGQLPVAHFSCRKHGNNQVLSRERCTCPCQNCRCRCSGWTRREQQRGCLSWSPLSAWEHKTYHFKVHAKQKIKKGFLFVQGEKLFFFLFKFCFKSSKTFPNGYVSLWWLPI